MQLIEYLTFQWGWSTRALPHQNFEHTTPTFFSHLHLSNIVSALRRWNNIYSTVYSTYENKYFFVFYTVVEAGCIIYCMHVGCTVYYILGTQHTLLSSAHIYILPDNLFFFLDGVCNQLTAADIKKEKLWQLATGC